MFPRIPCRGNKCKVCLLIRNQVISTNELQIKYQLPNQFKCIVLLNFHHSYVLSELRYEEHSIMSLALYFNHIPVFIQSDTVATIFFLLPVFMWLLFECSVYFFGKHTSINDGWIRYIQANSVNCQMLVSGMCSLSVMLSAVDTSHTTQTALALTC